MKDYFKELMKTSLSACQIERVCRERELRLSVMGWSQYAVEDGVLKLHHHYGGDEYTEEIQSAEELNFFNPERVADFEYSQTITKSMIKALRS